MSEKKRVLHIIDNLKRGGAEILLLDVVKNLNQYKNCIVTLTDETGFGAEELAGLEIISLNFTTIKSLPGALLRLRKLLVKYEPSLIHAHLPFSSFMARIAKPAKVPLFITIHNKYSQSLKAISPRLFFLEKLLHSKRERLIFVSAAIREDYERIIGIKGPSFLLYNFLADKYFKAETKPEAKQPVPASIRLVAVGSLKPQKNYDALLTAFNLLERQSFSLDIYGNGPERERLERLICQYGLDNVHLKGTVTDVEKVLPNYDAFILVSKYEGFGLAPLEAAAMGLPLLLSNIDVFKEVTKGYATFFSPDDINDIVSKLLFFKSNYQEACELAKEFRPKVLECYSMNGYIRRLLSIYQESWTNNSQ